MFTVKERIQNLATAGFFVLLSMLFIHEFRCMMAIATYLIEVPEGTPGTEEALKKIIEDNAHIFEGMVMANYRGDQRYSYQSDNFEITDINTDGFTCGSFEFEVGVQYYEGCKDKDFFDMVDGSADFTYDREKRCLKFELDETVWNPDN
ncbi:TPA: hypothetical protein QCK11_000258 [Enterobacter asburiae]|nr:hypothetical protein [Enterobacter asburiae]HDR2805884.1 hypothetical protein [Enterobacter asburiae]HDR2810578.1 hypothetical protein [Enterobacter asburiae]HDR2815954.1 hypothetical protein [Enterobacter asburiae]HDR2860352.1 hypothetical protein [Enterobacter asburiae]